MTGDKVVRKHPHAKCEECPLLDKGKFVPSTFPSVPINEDSNHGRRIVLVGESPGRQEVLRGTPFIGPSGQVMNAVLVEHNIDRGQLLVTNAFNCHYSENDFEKPPPEAVIACRPRLLYEIKQVEADTAITVGAVAATALINTKVGISKLRTGAPRLSSYAPEVEVVPTFHPAFALRDQSKFPYIVRDVAKLIPGGVWGTWQDPNIEVIWSPAIASKYINSLRTGAYTGPITVDTESGADKEETFGGGINEVLCIGVWQTNPDGGKVLVFTPGSLDAFRRKQLGQLFMQRGIVTQNGKYDTTRCLNVYLGGVDSPLDIPVQDDTMLMSYALDEGKGVHGLDYMAIEYLDAPDHKKIMRAAMEEGRRRAKAERKAKKLPIKGMFSGVNFALVDKPTLHWYNGIDVYSTERLRHKFEPELLDGKVHGLYRWLISVNKMLAHVETAGLAVDLDYNMELELKYKEMLAGIDFGGVGDINPNSWQQVKKYLSTMGIRVESTNKTTLRGLIERSYLTGRDDVADFCQALLDYRGASKLMGTYVTGLRANLINSVAHPSFLLHSTTTGRPSCRNPNLQNIPRGSDMRRQFVVSRSGRIFVQADYAQAEFRVLTWMAQDELMRQMFNDGTQDAFVLLCQRMYRETYTMADKAVAKEMRTMIKTMAYGIMYGREAKAIALAFGIPLREAQRQMREFQAMIPDITRYQQGVVERVMAGEDLVNPFGRRRRFHLITDANKIDVCNEAKAQLPQSTSSDICLESARQLDLMGLEIRNIVHDSILTECDKRDMLDVARIMEKTMVGVAEQVTEGYVRFAVDVEVGTNWGGLQPLAT